MLYTDLCSCRCPTHFIWKKFSSGSYPVLSAYEACAYNVYSVVCTRLFAKYWHVIYLVRAAVVLLQVSRWQGVRSVEESTRRMSQNIASFGTCFVSQFRFSAAMYLNIRSSVMLRGLLWRWLPAVPIGLLDMSVANYQPTPHNILEELRTSNFCCSLTALSVNQVW